MAFRDTCQGSTAEVSSPTCFCHPSFIFWGSEQNISYDDDAVASHHDMTLVAWQLLGLMKSAIVSLAAYLKACLSVKYFA
jgi:hypothetical protein